MKFNLSRLLQEFKISPSDYILVHVGASTCQEADYYNLFKFQKVFWIEALPEICRKAEVLIETFPNQELIEALCFSKAGRRFYMWNSNNGSESSSILKPALHRKVHPNVEFIEEQRTIVSTTLDQVMSSRLQNQRVILVLDVQGAERYVLEGATETLARTDFVFSEVSTIKLYKKQVLFHRMVRMLKSHGFAIADHDITLKSPYGDALFTREAGSSQKYEIRSTTLLFSVLASIYHNTLSILVRRVFQKVVSLL